MIISIVTVVLMFIANITCELFLPLHYLASLNMSNTFFDDVFEKFKLLKSYQKIILIYGFIYIYIQINNYNIYKYMHVVVIT